MISGLNNFICVTQGVINQVFNDLMKTIPKENNNDKHIYVKFCDGIEYRSDFGYIMHELIPPENPTIYENYFL